MSCRSYAPASSSAEKQPPTPIDWEAVWASGPFWTFSRREVCFTCRDLGSNRPARSLVTIPKTISLIHWNVHKQSKTKIKVSNKDMKPKFELLYLSHEPVLIYHSSKKKQAANYSKWKKKEWELKSLRQEPQCGRKCFKHSNADYVRFLAWKNCLGRSACTSLSGIETW